MTSLLTAAGLTTIGRVGGRGQPAAGELERDGLGRVVGEVGERRHATDEGDRCRSQERTACRWRARRHDRAVVARLDVAVLVLLVDQGWVANA